MAGLDSVLVAERGLGSGMNAGVLAHAGDLFQEYFPVLFLAGAVYVVITVLKEGKQKKDSTPEQPANPLHEALRSKQRRAPSSTAPSKSWGSWDSRPPTRPRPHRAEGEAAGSSSEPPPAP